MNKLFVIMGKSGSGKSTIEKEICRLEMANRVISTTTRSPRSYEIDSVDYYFISEDVFNIYLRQEQYAEHSEYPTVWGMAKYGINKNDIKLNEGNAICVVNPDGYRQLVKSLGKERVVGIYIDRDDRDRVISSIVRDKNNNLVSILEEIVRRLKSDEKDFKNIKEEVDYIINNDRNLSSVVWDIVDIIKKETK